MSTPTIVPLAQRLAEENNVNWRSLSGSGSDGSVTEVDVLNYLARVMAGEEDLNPTAEPVPAGMEAWPEEDVRAHKAAQAVQEMPASPLSPTASVSQPVAQPSPTPAPQASPTPAPRAPTETAPQPNAPSDAKSDAKPYVKKEVYVALLQKHKTLTEQYTALTGERAALETEAARAKTAAAKLEGELTTSRARVTTLEKELATLKEQTGSFTKERAEAAETIKRLPMLENENEALKTALAEEQAKLARHRQESEALSAAQKGRPWWKFWG